MSPYEVFYMIKKYCESDVEETILETVELLGKIRNDPSKFTFQLERELEEYADKNNRCSICGEEIVTKKMLDKCEYQGFDVDQPIYRKYCPNHGYID